MDKKLGKFGKVLLILFASIYLLFLILPFVLSPILNSYSDEISKAVEQSCGFKLKFDNMRIVTTPKLTAGVKIGKVQAFLPTDEKFLDAENFQVKMSLLPLLLRKLEIDVVSADSVNVDLKVQKDGKFLIENYIPESNQPKEAQKPTKMFFKLSNHLPDIRINKHNINFVDMSGGKKYSILGQDTKVSDFILDKKVKISSKGQVILAGRNQFNYDVKLLNKVMPKVQLNDLVFNPQPVETQQPELKINILDIFKGLYNNQLTANLQANLKASGDFDEVKLDGDMLLDNLSIAIKGKKLPSSFISAKFKGNKTVLDSDFYTAQNEITHIKGLFKTGKRPDIDMDFKSNAGFKSIFEIANSVLQSFGVNDLQSVSANGAIDADFNIKTNLKKLQSSGYLKIPNANVSYGLYNVAINNIHSDVSFDNSLVNIKNAGFVILGQPLKLYGTVKQDATADLHLLANNLAIKNLLVSMGQKSVLKDNVFKSGTISLDASMTGKLKNPVCSANVSVDNLNLKNIPSATTVTMSNSKVKIHSVKKGFEGSEVVNNFRIINPAMTVSIPNLTEIITPDTITINPSVVIADSMKLGVAGEIRNYLTNKITLDFKTTGALQSTLSGYIYPVSQKISLDFDIPNNCTIPIPGFKGSKMQARGYLGIAGSMANPYLSGKFDVPYILIPDMLVSMNDLVVNLNGPLAKGSGSVKKITSGTMVAQNLKADFLLKGNMFYLSNIVGDAYSGKVRGNVSYNVVNGKTGVDFSGAGMNATSAVLATSGIKNALSGTLGFDTNVTLQGIEYKDMVKSLRGNFSFNVTDGALGQVGKLENFLNAKNILANTVMRVALNSITSLATVRNTANFKYIKGSMTFANGWANILSIKTSGPTMAYFVKGKYNILNGTANLVILGRLSSDVVALLGPIGDLSVDKLTSYIPKFGPLTAVIIKSMTTNPAEENVSNIPPLSSGDKAYKDFKVVFNGGVDSQSSVKSFKWLSNVDTSVFDLKFNVKNVKKQFSDARNSAVSGVKKQYTDLRDSAVSGVKGTVNDTKKQIQDAAGEWKNLLKF